MSVLTHGAAFLGYAVFAILLAFRGARTWLTAFLLLACLMTAAWAVIVALVEWSLLPEWTAALAVPLRDGAWFALVLGVLYAAGQGNHVWRGLAVATACIVLIDTAFNATAADIGAVLGLPLDSRISGIVRAVMGLILVENMMRNLSRDQVWAVKLLGIGLFAVLGCELLVQLPKFLTNIPVSGLAAAPPLVFLMVLPLFVVTAVRSPALELRVHSSRTMVFRTSALIAIGILLQGMALAAYYVRSYGGDNATVLLIVLGFSGVIAVAVAIASASVRSRLMVFINENFFSYKYDYRLEWDKFIRALSTWEDRDISLRVLRTLAEILDSPGGALWVRRDRWRQFMPVASWSFRSELAPIALDDPALRSFKDESCAYLALTVAENDASSALWHERFPGAWLAVPLRYRSDLIGVALINRPRAERKLDWEDKKLVALVALQLAAYLSQEETVQALADARQLEDFNKRFAFILHDTKNTIGQLGLLVHNAEKFGHDEQFRKDMIITLRNSVEKLQDLLAQLKGTGNLKLAKPMAGENVDVTALVSDFVQEKCRQGLNVIIDKGGNPILGELTDRKAFLGVLEHVIMNAIEASPNDSCVDVRVGRRGDSVCVSVEDKGRGMTQQFIADELFRPLRTTKGTGFGIGAYQAREIIRDLGGDIDVRSKVGEGTTVTLLLPTASLEREMARA